MSLDNISANSDRRKYLEPVVDTHISYLQHGLPLSNSLQHVNEMSQMTPTSLMGGIASVTSLTSEHHSAVGFANTYSVNSNPITRNSTYLNQYSENDEQSSYDATNSLTDFAALNINSSDRYYNGQHGSNSNANINTNYQSAIGGGNFYNQNSNNYTNYKVNNKNKQPGAQYGGNNMMTRRNVSGMSRPEMGATGPSQPVYGNNYSNSPPVMFHNNSAQSVNGLNPRVLNTYFLDIMKEPVLNGPLLNEALNMYIEAMDSVNLATILFHTGKKKFTLNPQFIQRIAVRFHSIDGEFRAREASNTLYGLRNMSSDVPEVRLLVKVLAVKLSQCSSVMVAQAIGNALYGMQVLIVSSDILNILVYLNYSFISIVIIFRV